MEGGPTAPAALVRAGGCAGSAASLPLPACQAALCLSVAALALLIAAAPAPAAAQSATFKPEVGQPGKDVVWVPTPEVMVEKMLDMAKVGPDDFVIDLGSGDGRNVIGAAKRGARALGVEYNPDMVELSRRNATAAGVGERARFERGDMYEADISKASVMALFLLPSNLLQLRPKFLALAPGSRIVSNTFLIADWTPDASDRLDGCEMWCEVHLWIVPAQAGGTLAPAGWRADPHPDVPEADRHDDHRGRRHAGDRLAARRRDRAHGRRLHLARPCPRRGARAHRHRRAEHARDARAPVNALRNSEPASSRFARHCRAGRALRGPRRRWP